MIIKEMINNVDFNGKIYIIY